MREYVWRTLTSCSMNHANIFLPLSRPPPLDGHQDLSRLPSCVPCICPAAVTGCAVTREVVVASLVADVRRAKSHRTANASSDFFAARIMRIAIVPATPCLTLLGLRTASSVCSRRLAPGARQSSSALSLVTLVRLRSARRGAGVQAIEQRRTGQDDTASCLSDVCSRD